MGRTHRVDGEVRRIVDEQYSIARKLIEANKDKIEAMTQALLEWETIDSDQIKDIMDGRPPRPPKPPQISSTTSNESPPVKSDKQGEPAAPQEIVKEAD